MLLIHWRLIAAFAVGTGAWLVARWLGAPAGSTVLIGWNVGAAAYVAMAWAVIVGASEAQVKAHAARDDEAKGVFLAIVMLAVAVSFAAILTALLGVGRGPERGVVAALAAVTLVSSWLLLQTVFVFHYAHRHFQAEDGKGFQFPGDPPRSYLDFAYLALCIGATAQVSDPGVGATRLRNLVTTHAVISFFYNTAILALGINIVAGLLGH